MSDPRTNDPTGTGLDKGTGDPNDDRAYLDDLPPAQVQDEPSDDGAVDADDEDADV